MTTAWHDNAGRLADWALARCVNRDDAWGGYYADAAGAVRPYTAKAGPRRGRLDAAPRAAHVRAAGPDDVVGTHALAGGLGRWLAVDIDHHGVGDADPWQNERFAVHVSRRLGRAGLEPLLYESNGKGGYHLWAFLAEPAPGEVLYRLARWAAADWKAFGFPKPAETFPKQPAVPEGGYGNWLRLPGRHPKRDVYPRVLAADGRWAAGAAAVELVLACRGASLAGVPAAALADPEPPRVTPGRSAVASAANPGGGELPGREFNRSADWPGILEPHGWRRSRRLPDGVEHWTRPGKDGDTSATLGFLKTEGDRVPLFYVFTTGGAPFASHRYYTPFEALALLDYRGDFRACARELREKGYGSKGA